VFCHLGLARLYLERCDFDLASNAINAAWNYTRQGNFQRGFADCYRLLARLYTQRDDEVLVGQAYSASIEKYRELGIEEALTLVDLGLIAYALANGDSFSLLGRGLDLARERRSVIFEAFAHKSLHDTRQGNWRSHGDHAQRIFKMAGLEHQISLRRFQVSRSVP
jgi:hypothetical protein